MITGKISNLRAVEIEDSTLYHKWINDAETNFWRGLYHPTSLQDARDFISTESHFTSDKLTLGIETLEKSLVGLIGLRGICPRSRRAEVWIYLGDKEIWGRGLGSDAVAVLCQYAFDEMNLHRLWLECEPENIGAVRCYEKCGFVIEGRCRDGYFRHGSFRDTITMALLRTDWKNRP